ncbi:MAG: hypothetical protein Q4E13_08530 [Clostridia bacterium]|nr:hypothetical protein [Clostridia bacterium]
MSVKIRVSYETDDELDMFMQMLELPNMRVKKPAEQKGRYKQAYVSFDPKQFDKSERMIHTRTIRSYPID